MNRHKRQAAKQPLENSAQYLQIAFDESSIAKVFVSLDGHFLKVNRAACTLLGYPEAELLTKSVRDVSHPDDIAPTEAMLEPILAGQRLSAQMEKRFVQKDGTVVWALVNTVLIRAADGAPLFRISEAQDITERKRIEEKLREAEMRFRLLSEASPTAIYIIQDGVLQYVNPTFVELLGYPIEQLLGSDPLSYIYPDDVPLAREKLGQRLSGQVKKLDYQCRMVRKNGGIRYIHIYSSVTESLASGPLVIGNLLDITEQRQAELAAARSLVLVNAIINSTIDLIWSVDAEQFGLLTWNQALQEYFQAGRGIMLEIGMRPEELFPPESSYIQTWRQLYQRALADGSYTTEYRVFTGNRVLLLSLNLLQQEGQVFGISVFGKDITEIKRSNEMLQISEQAAHRIAEQLRMINQMMGILIGSLDFESRMQKLHEICQRIGDTDTFYVFLYDKETGTISSPYNYKDGVRLQLPVRDIREKPGVTGYVIEHPQTLYIPDTLQLPPGVPPIIVQPGRQTRSLVIVPLMLSGQVIGVVSMQSCAVNAYTPDQIQALELLAPQAAIALQNSRLYEQERNERNLVNALIDNLPGIFLLVNQSGRLQRWNKYVEMTLGYPAEKLGELDILSLIVPQDRALYAGLVAQCFAEGGGTAEMRLVVSGGKAEIPFYVTGARVQLGDELYLSAIGLNITERKRAEEALRQQIDQNQKHVRELEAIAQVSAKLRQVQTRAEMIQILLEESMRVLEAQGGALGLLNGNSLVIWGAAGLVADIQGQVIAQNDGLGWQVIQDGMPRFFDGKSGEVASVFVSLLNDMQNGIHSGILTPLKSDDLTIGVSFLGYVSPQPVPADRRRLASAIAEFAGSALHRVSMSETLEKIVADRTRELQTIYQIVASVGSRLELRPAIQSALALILPAVASDAGAVLLWDEPHGHFDVLAAQGLSQSVIDYLERADNQSGPEGRALANRKPFVLADLADVSTDKRLPFKYHGRLPFAALPMTIGDQVIGILDVARRGGEPFDLEELTLLTFIADHLGLVIENSLLFWQIEDQAVLAERSRMARALHDSVTQLLYSIVLYAEGANRLADQANWEQVQANLAELGQIARQALKEMRLMVYELRSPALHNGGLAKAIQHRLNSVEMRSGIQASVVADRVPRLLERTEEALYRIALEALNNSLKHAQAKNVTVFIRRTKNELRLCVRDDGVGFSVEEKAHSGGLGILGINERVERLNGQLEIRSAPGGGCEVEVVIPISGNRAEQRSYRRQKS